MLLASHLSQTPKALITTTSLPLMHDSSQPHGIAVQQHSELIGSYSNGCTQLTDLATVRLPRLVLTMMSPAQSVVQAITRRVADPLYWIIRAYTKHPVPFLVLPVLHFASDKVRPCLLLSAKLPELLLPIHLQQSFAVLVFQTRLHTHTHTHSHSHTSMHKGHAGPAHL